MRFTILAACALAAAVAGAGCTALPEGEPVDPADAPGPTPAAPTPEQPTPASPTPASPTPASPTPEPAPAPSENDTAPDEPPAASQPHTTVVTGNASTTAEVGPPACPPEPAPCRAGHETGEATLPIEEPGPDRAVLVATWNASSAAAETLVVDVQDGDGNLLASGSGESPLTLEIPTGSLDASVEALHAMPRPDAAGAMVEQTVSFVLTLTYY